MRSALTGFLVAVVHLAWVAASLAGPLVIAGGAVRSVLQGDSSLRVMLTDWPRWGHLLGTTVMVVSWAMGVTVVMGLPAAALIFKCRLSGRRPLIALLMFLAAIPIYVVSGSLLSITGKEALLGSVTVVGILHGVACLPLAVLIGGIGLRRPIADLEEAAMVDGAGISAVFCRITLPLGIGGVIASALLVALWTATDYSVSDLLLVRTFAEEVYTQYAIHGRPEEAAWTAFPQITIMLIVLALLWGQRGRYEPQDWSRHEVYEYRPKRAGRLLSALAWLPLLALGAAIVLPLLRLALGGVDLIERVGSFTPEIRVSAGTSLFTGLLTAALSVGLAWYHTRRRRWRILLTAYLGFMLAYPAPLLAIGMIQFFNRPGILGLIYDSPAIIILGQVFRFLPVGVVLMIPIVRAIPEECEMAARLDGCGSAGVWARIVWPLCLPAAGFAFFVVTILALGELPCSLLLAPPGYWTIASRYFSLIHYGFYADASRLCLTSLFIVLLPWVGLVLLLPKRVMR